MFPNRHKNDRNVSVHVILRPIEEHAPRSAAYGSCGDVPSRLNLLELPKLLKCPSSRACSACRWSPFVFSCTSSMASKSCGNLEFDVQLGKRPDSRSGLVDDVPHNLEGLQLNIPGCHVVATTKAVVVLTWFERLQANIALTKKNTLLLLNYLPSKKTQE